MTACCRAARRPCNCGGAASVHRASSSSMLGGCRISHPVMTAYFAQNYAVNARLFLLGGGQGVPCRVTGGAVQPSAPVAETPCRRAVHLSPLPVLVAAVTGPGMSRSTSPGPTCPRQFPFRGEQQRGQGTQYADDGVASCRGVGAVGGEKHGEVGKHRGGQQRAHDGAEVANRGLLDGDVGPAVEARFRRGTSSRSSSGCDGDVPEQKSGQAAANVAQTCLVGGVQYQPTSTEKD
jgi:hypothetical protein